MLEYPSFVNSDDESEEEQQPTTQQASSNNQVDRPSSSCLDAMTKYLASSCIFGLFVNIGQHGQRDHRARRRKNTPN